MIRLLGRSGHVYAFVDLWTDLTLPPLDLAFAKCAEIAAHEDENFGPLTWSIVLD